MVDDLFLGVDIGGTKTIVAIFNQKFTFLDKVTVPTLPEHGCGELVERIFLLYRSLLERNHLQADQVCSLGVACPGPLDLKTGRIVYIPTMGFRDEPLLAYFREQFALPVFLENDTNAAALGESVFGKGIGCHTVVYITISTGVGCGITVGGRIMDGQFFAAGEIGHMKVERHGRLCACGGKGCLEAYASGTSIAEIASERIGQTISTKEAFDLARKEVHPILDVVREASEYLGCAIATVYQLLDPDVVILGGSVTKDYDVLEPFLLREIKNSVQKIPGRIPRVEISDFQGDQVVLGAAYYGKMCRDELQDNRI